MRRFYTISAHPAINRSVYFGTTAIVPPAIAGGTITGVVLGTVGLKTGIVLVCEGGVITPLLPWIPGPDSAGFCGPGGEVTIGL
jgi:hypothetical protein